MESVTNTDTKSYFFRSCALSFWIGSFISCIKLLGVTFILFSSFSFYILMYLCSLAKHFGCIGETFLYNKKAGNFSCKNFKLFLRFLFKNLRTGDERIELPLKVLETLVIPFDQSPLAKHVALCALYLYHIHICLSIVFIFLFIVPHCI